MTMRLVSRQLYIGDEGRPIFNAGLFSPEPYYIPPDDVPTLDRRRLWLELSAFTAFTIALFGAAENFWSGWWSVAALFLVILAPVMTARWVRQRFEPVTNPSVRLNVRRTAIMHAPTVGAAFTAIVVMSGQWFSIAVQRRQWFTFALVTGVLLVQVVTALAHARERREAEAEYVPPSSGITR